MFMSGSYLHQKWLDDQKDMYRGEARELQNSETTDGYVSTMLVGILWIGYLLYCGSTGRNLMDRLPAVL